MEKKALLLLFCLVCSISSVTYHSTSLYPPLPSSRGIDILVPFANSNDLAACLVTDHHTYEATFLVYNLSSSIAPTYNHVIYNYTLPNNSYIDYLDGLNSFGQEYFAGFFEIDGQKQIQIFNYTGIQNPVFKIDDVWQRVIIQGQANVKCSSCLLYGTMNYDGSWNFIQYDWMKQKQLFKITTDESLDDVYMLDTEMVGGQQTVVYSAQKFVSPFVVFSFVMVSSDGTEIWRKETSQENMVIQAQQYYGDYMLVVSLNQQVQLINRSTGEAYDELNTGFSSDLRCTGMYPHVACTDYSVVKIWDWDPLKGTVATLVGSVSETESMLSLIFICFKEFTTLDIITSDSNLYTLLAITSALSISEQLKKRNLN